MPYLYLSSAPADLDLARSVRARLETAGYTTWMDEYRTFDESLRPVLRSAIESAAVMIVVCRDGRELPAIVQWELQCARDRRTAVVNVRTPADVDGVLENLINTVARSDTPIPLPMPIYLPTAPAAHPIRFRTVVLLMTGIAVVALLFWIVQALALDARRSADSAPTTLLPTLQYDASESEAPAAAPAKTDDTASQKRAHGNALSRDERVDRLHVRAAEPIRTLSPSLAGTTR